MKFGLFYELEVPEKGYTERDVWHNALDQMELAEKVGFDSAYAVEHHFNPGYSHSPCPEILMAAASQRTKTMRLGSGVILLPFTHPVRCAERVAALDILTDGRFDFGVGRGAARLEFSVFDKPYAQGETKGLNRELFVESLEVMKRCWTEDNVTHHGKFFHIPEPICVVPKPVQKPYPKLWAACGSPDSFDMYPRMGLHIMPNTAVQPLDKLAEQLPMAYKAWEEAGHAKKEPLQVANLVPVYCAPTRQKAVEGMRDYELWYFGKLLEFFSPKALLDEMKRFGWERPSWDYIFGEKMVICGDPDDCIEQVKDYQAAGITRIMGQFQVGGMPHQQVMAAIDLFGREVIPQCL